MWKDAIVEEVRRIRNEHAARFNGDLTAICRDLKERERTSGRRYVRFEPKRLPVKKAGDGGSGATMTRITRAR